MYFSLKYIFFLIIVVDECVSKSTNHDNLQLKFVFIVSTYINIIIYLRILRYTTKGIEIR